MSSFVAVPYGEICLSKGGTPVKKKLLRTFFLCVESCIASENMVFCNGIIMVEEKAMSFDDISVISNRRPYQLAD